MKTLSLFLTLLVSVQALLLSPAFAVDLAKIEQALTHEGVLGWVHGAVAEQGMYVFTYRNPQNFFDAIQMSLVSEDAKINEQLKAITRNDQVRVKGEFLKNSSPQKHILVSGLEIVKKFEPAYPSDPYQHEAKIPAELLSLKSATFLVHAVAGEGHVLVVEFKDTVIPMIVKDEKNAAVAKTLYKNDLVKLSFVTKGYPDQPTHVTLDAKATKPIEVLESVKALNGKPVVMEGSLIMFQKSPEIVMNVFAVEQKLPAGLSRQFTIVNFEDGDVFLQARELMQKAWDQHPGEFKNTRNKLTSTKLKVRVTGEYSMISQNQANAQILIKSVKDVVVLDH